MTLKLTAFLLLITSSFLALAQPSIFGEGVISTGDYESHPAFSVGGDTLYFLKCSADISTWTICVTYHKQGKWTAPEIAPFSGQFKDGDPFITRDGKEFYFISNRAVSGDSAKADMDIWKMTKMSTGWSKPVRLPEPINSSADEYYPTLTDNGTIYFGSERENGDCDIYKSALVNRKYSAAENLGDAINSNTNEYEPFIAPDESYLIFMATSPNGLTNGDLYYSNRIKGVWQKAKKLPPPFNSSGTEWSPKVSRDGKWFFFGSTRSKSVKFAKPESTEEMNKRIRSAGNGLSDIYRIKFETLKNAINK
jgi:Tol biopolymer transport system component